jgi:hypothetical protein
LIKLFLLNLLKDGYKNDIFLLKKIKKNITQKEMDTYKDESLWFVEKYIDRVDWNYISANSNLSEEFFEKYIDRVNWYYISRNTNLSEAFFEKYIDRLIWYFISQNSNLSVEFFEKYIDRVDWLNISGNHSIVDKNCFY